MRVKYYYGIMAYLCDVSLYGMLYVADTATAAKGGELLSGRSVQVSGERLKCILIL